MNAAADEGRAQMEAGCTRADALIAVTGDDAKNLVICQLAKLQCKTPRVIARVNNPKNEIVFKTLGIDETISSTRVLMSVIEQELPAGGFMPLMPLAGSDNEMIEAEIAPGAPPAGKNISALRLPAGALVGGIIRRGKLLHADDDTRLEVGDRVLVFAATDSESEVRKALMG
jgi:trk system potassium uptake protein TrkA